MKTQEPVFAFPLQFDRTGTGRMRALHEQLRAAILDRRIPAGTLLPSTRRVAESYGIARNSVIGAYDLLTAEGYVLPRRGAKAVVADVAAHRSNVAQRSVRAPVEVNPVWLLPQFQPRPPRNLPPRSFRLGMPEYRHFPHDVWRRLASRAMRAWSKAPFAYAPSRGILPLREAIAQHVAFTRAVVCTADDIVVTSGAQQAFDLVTRAFVRAGVTRVAVEEPGYPPARAALVAAGAKIASVPVDDEGLIVDRLPRGIRIIFVTPSHQSPTGAALSLRRRMALLEYARRNDTIIVEDDYDGEFVFGARPLDALQMLDRDARVFYVGTFSKSLFPSLRKGFIVAPPWARDALIAVKHSTDAHSDALMQNVLASFILDGHMARHVRRMRSLYAARRTALLHGIERHLSGWLDPIPSEVGLHLAARVRDRRMTPRIFAQAAEHLPGAHSIAEYATAAPMQPALALGYGVIDAAEIPRALMRLRTALESRR
jgi:GntR family transcriptional regulator/MocR family aminotransferase